MRRTLVELRKLVSRWQRGPHLRHDRNGEDGDTLVEVLLTIVIVGLTAVALLLGFATSISSTAEHRNLTSLDAAARVAVDAAINGVQNHANQAFPCNPNGIPGFNAATLTLPNGFTVVNPTVTYWSLSGNAFGACDTTDANGTYLPQQYTMHITSPTGNYTTTVSTVGVRPRAHASAGRHDRHSVPVGVARFPGRGHGRTAVHHQSPDRGRGQQHQHRHERFLVDEPAAHPGHRFGHALQHLCRCRVLRHLHLQQLQHQRRRHVLPHGDRL